MSDKSYTCPQCGLTLPRFSGPTPSTCPACGPSKNRARAIERLREQNPAAADQVEAAIAAGQILKDDEDPPELKAALRAAAPQLMAVTMSMVSKPAEAAQLAGLSVLAEEDPDWFKGVVRTARRVHKPLIEARPEAIGGIINAALGRLAMRVFIYADRVPPAQAATTMRALAQVAELTQGGSAKKVHTDITVNIAAEVVVRTVADVQAAEEAEL